MTPIGVSDQILSWLIVEEMGGELICVAFAYTKAPFRRMGLLRHMLSRVNPLGLPIVYPFKTRVSGVVGEKLSATFEPFCIIEGVPKWLKK